MHTFLESAERVECSFVIFYILAYGVNNAHYAQPLHD
jgi:hypothetical protein